MLGKWIGQNTIWKGILNSWRGIYCMVLPIIAVGVYIVCYRVWKVKIWESENFPATLESMVTFVSIIISFFWSFTYNIDFCKRKVRAYQLLFGFSR